MSAVESRERYALERARQIDEKRFVPALDLGRSSELAAAAAAYLQVATFLEHGGSEVATVHPPRMWPWGSQSWNPGTPKRMREKAAALMMAAVTAMEREDDELGYNK